MRIPAVRRRRKGENIGPLIDVVFLLLLFFLLAGTPSPPEAFSIDPPRSEGAQAAESHTVLVLLTADGQLAVDERKVTRAELAAVVAERLAGAELPTIALKADAAVASDSVIAAMEILRGTGVQTLRLLTVDVSP
jgi:biopolymer transport protein ExbD